MSAAPKQDIGHRQGFCYLLFIGAWLFAILWGLHRDEKHYRQQREQWAEEERRESAELDETLRRGREAIERVRKAE